MAKRKKTRLNKVEKFFVESNAGMGLEWIMENLGDDYSEKAITNLLEKQKHPKVMDNFARRDGVVLMTEEQSEEDDEFVPMKQQMSRTNHIHKIAGE